MSKKAQTLGKKVFNFDSCDDYFYLKSLFIKANQSFLKYDFDLIKTDVAEATLCGALKSR